ncbi:glycosyltransferase family 4 protein [Phocaeicola sartorii]|uniref:glycosyltransferase family 4 protein n=1 Tax=Phocaeicola sartorii TaxID=671267 RepID=UPI001F5AA5AE|nr:glycosyltransferase family 4 protein [Phocaeicola sartorii]
MKIAYLINVGLSVSPYNGIRIQAETWADELERQGHEVVRINPWKTIVWEEFDVVHCIGADRATDVLLMSLSKRCKNIMFSPVIDSIEPIGMYRFATLWGSKRFRLYSVNYAIRLSKPYISKWFVRSQYEFEYVNKAYNVPAESISIIPLSFRTPICEKYPEKEPFCLHVSMLTDGRKNVLRLLEAAVKYQFKLVLAGSVRSNEEFAPLKCIIEANDNITYLGSVSDERLIALYKRAKVFALPSINEGVGMVAVEAASYGCDIVVTEIGGPKEYYSDMAYVVNPYNVDEIGKAVMNAMSESRFQPRLQKYIQDNYNLETCVGKMVNEYMRNR